MNLTVIEKHTFEAMPLGLRQYAERRIGQKQIKDIEPSVLKVEVQNIISKAFADQGQLKVESDILAYQRENLLSELKRGQFGTLTLPEVQNAFICGIRGESGPFFGMCPKTYHQFLKYEFERPQRTESVKEYLKLSDKVSEKPKVSQEDSDKMLVSKAIEYFEGYKRSGELEYYAHYCNDALKRKLGLKQFVTDKADQDRIKLEAERVYTERVEKSISENKFKGRFDEAQKLGEMLAHGLQDNQSYKNLVKQLSLKFYFDKLIKSGLSIKELVK